MTHWGSNERLDILLIVRTLCYFVPLIQLMFVKTCSVTDHFTSHDFMKCSKLFYPYACIFI